MPLSRYQIRNEYSLADPQLYRAADKDDPEALLEGIAMAGLVGVLRQLGDLAEFAAEIFHDLHDQVMATASRGHSLTIRVQQLEAEFPSIEKAFLSQTIHSSFYYNAGTEWHPNLRMDQNLITHGDLPRFIMDSYEECRGPPRLFLLDKFDVAGAGACLKRYTDPSFFKVETSYSDVIRDKKTRKAKKKGSRWRHGETPETLPTSHAKLHQLFLEERVENGTLRSAGHVKLKRRLNGFPFDTKSGKSYMEKFLKPPSPNHDEVHEIPEDLSLLALPSNSTYESAVEVVEISMASPEKKSRQRTRSSNLSPAREGLELVMDKQNEVPSAEGSVEVSKSKLGFQTFEISSTSHRVSSEKDIPVDGGMKIEERMDDNQSDDFASEIDNYVDALTTMDSEIDTDSEFRAKSNVRYLNKREWVSDVDVNDAQVQVHSSDSLSGNSTLSDDGSNSSKKDLSIFSYSDTRSTSAENVPLDSEVSSNALTSSEIHEAKPSSIRQSIDEERQLSWPMEDTVSDGAFVKAIEISNRCFDFRDRNSSSSPEDSAVVCENTDAVKNDTALADIEKDDMVTLSVDLPFISSVADIFRQKGDYLPPKTSGEILDEFEGEDAIKTEKIVFTSGHSVASLSKYNFPLQVSSEKQSVDESDDENVNEDGNVDSIKECLIVPCVVEENLSSFSPEISALGELLDGDKSLSAANHCLDFLQDGDKVSPTISLENLPLDNFGVEVPNYVLDASVGMSNIVEPAAAEREIAENVLEDGPQISHGEDDSIHKSVEHIVGSQNSVLPLPEDQLSDPINEELETHYSGEEFDERSFEADNSTPSAGERAENFILKVDSPAICETVESCDPGTMADVQLLAPAKEQILYLTREYCDLPSIVGDGAIVDKAASYADFIETRTTAGTSLLAEVHTHLNEGDYALVTGGAAVTGHDDELSNIDVELSNIDNDFSSVDLKKLQEGSLCSFRDDELCGLEYETLFLNKPGKSNQSEDELQKKFTSSDVNNLQDTVSDDNLRPIICNDGRYFPSGADSGLNLTDAPSTQSSAQQYEQEPHCFEEHIDFQPKQLGVDLLSECDDNSEWLTKLQEEHVTNHDDHFGTFDTCSESMLKNISSQSSTPEQLSLGNNKVDVSGHYLDLSKSTSSTYSLFPDCGQIYVEEMPPLPPLPPVQWRMGKFPSASPAHERVIESHNSTAFPSPLSSSINKEAQDSNLFLPQPAFAYEKPGRSLSEQLICNSSSFLSQIPPMVHHGDPKGNVLPSKRFEVTGAPLQSSRSQGQMQQNDFQAGEGKKAEPSLDAFCHASIMDATNPLKLSHEGFAKPVNQMVSETSLRDLEHQHSVHSEKNIAILDTTETSVKIANEDEIPRIEGNLLQPFAEDGILNGSRIVKLARPRNPLIDAVVALDKSKLRKVAERAKPQIQKEGGRDSLLEQIRTKSFNLKPAAVTRPSIQGPKTNLKVAAILEKAKTIRQAFAGSDEDEDDDSWSDS